MEQQGRGGVIVYNKGKENQRNNRGEEDFSLQYFSIPRTYWKKVVRPLQKIDSKRKSPQIFFQAIQLRVDSH